MNTKTQLEQYLNEITKQLDMHDLHMFCTEMISKEVHLSRTLTSQYLNELNKEKKVVKVSSRPVYYFAAKALEELLGNDMCDLEFLNMAEFNDFVIKRKHISRDFSKAIGYNGTLQYCIDQMKSAVLYPPDGLHVLLYGKKGSGKCYLVRLLYEFSCHRKLFTQNARFMEVDVKKNNTTAMKQLFGEQGILHQLPEGLLHIRNAEYMDMELQDRLQEQLLKLSASRTKRNFRIVVSMNSDHSDELQKALLYMFPLNCRIPSFNERSMDEKEDFILTFLKKEQERMQKKINISTMVFQLLMNDSCIDGIMDLKSCIRNICANAYVRSEEHDEQCYVRLQHLPLNLLEKAGSGMVWNEQKERCCMLDDYFRHEEREKILLFFEDILKVFSQYKAQEIIFSRLLEKAQDILQEYYDYLVFETKTRDAQFHAFEKLIDEVVQPILKESEISVPQNCVFVLTHIRMAEMRHNSGICLWIKEHRQMIQECLNTAVMEMPMEYALTQSISSRLKEMIDFQLDPLNQIFMMLNINFYNRDLDEQSLHGIIISHGYCTASSIADAVNRLLDKNVFDAIDMPLNMDFSEIENVLNHQIDLHPRWKSLILMVDMGSLEEIGAYVHANIKVGVLNNISTGTALEVGSGILRNALIEEILPAVCEQSACHYRLIQPKKKEKAILVTNDAGVAVSRRLSELFRSSLPRNVNLRFIEYDYEKLLKNREQDGVFEQYDVRLVVKPYQLELKYYTCVELEEIINFTQINKVDEALRFELNEDEIQMFHDQLLKNFSLQNIMENLTILNPRKLLDFVSLSINELQRQMERPFDIRSIVGIYIHVSLLIERLVTNHPIDYIGNLDDFMKDQAAFIEKVQNSFHAMLNDYNVILPMSEIYYLFNYIEGDAECKMEDTI